MRIYLTNAFELTDVEKEIEIILHSLSLTVDGHPGRPLLLACLGRSYVKRFDLCQEPNDATKAIEYTTRALDLASQNHPFRPVLLDTLGESYCDRFKRLGAVDDVENAIELGSLALASTPKGHPILPDRLSALGLRHRDRFERLCEMHDLEAAIDYDSRALALTPPGHYDLPHRLYSLSVSFGVRFQHLGELDDVEKMITYASQSVDLIPDDGDLRKRDLLYNLGAAYNLRFGHLDELDDLQKAIEFKSRMVELTPNGYPDASLHLDSLAMSHSKLFQRLGELSDLDKAIDYGSRALALAPNGHPHLSTWHGNLGGFHSIRFQRLGELSDLEQAIKRQNQALDLTPNGHPDLPLRLDTLGVSHHHRYERFGRLSDLHTAIEYQARGLNLTLDGRPDLPARLANTAVSHKTRFKRLHKLEDLDKAIEYETRALALTPKGHPNLPPYLSNFGLTYSERYRYLGELDDLNKAIYYNSRALELTPDGHPHIASRHYNLAVLHVDQFWHTSDLSHLRMASDSFHIATHSEVGSPGDKFKYAFTWAKLGSKLGVLNPLEAHQIAIELLSQFIWLGATTNQRYEDLRAAESLAVSAASVAICCSNYPLALEWLEHARCVVWNQSLMLRSPIDQLALSHPTLADRLRAISNRLHAASFERGPSQSHTIEQVAQEHHRLAKQYNELLHEVRSLPGFEDFLQPKKSSSLIGAAKAGPIVVINCHEDQCDALLILPQNDEVRHIPLPDFSHDMARYVWNDVRKTLARQGLRERKPYFACQQRDVGDLEDALRLIWYGIVKPVLDHLGYTCNIPTHNLPHITWCPTGPISFLPLHAAGDYDQPDSRVYNYVVSSYTPTLTTLLASSPSVLNSNPKILGVCQEATPGHSPLPGTAKELEYIKFHIQKLAKYTPLLNHKATPAAVLDKMGQYDWIHLACHAHQNVGNPTESGFFLQGGVLTLSSINSRPFQNKGLAFLSACQTATGDENLPDEAVHLASGMLMAGYTSVIGTMWSVHDDDAPLIADKVYEQLMRDGKIGNGEAGKALHYAVAELRKKLGEKEFGRWVPYIHMGS